MPCGFIRQAIYLASIACLTVPQTLLAQPGDGSPLSSLLSAMEGLESFRANVTINGSLTGTLSYKKPANLHVQFSDGRILASNGRTLWFYSPERAVTGKQDLKGMSEGIAGLVFGYEDFSSGKTIRLKSDSKRYSEIVIVLDANHLPKSLRLQSSGSGITEIVFSGVTTNLGLSASLFNYQPPSSSMIIENPLNYRE